MATEASVPAIFDIFDIIFWVLVIGAAGIYYESKRETPIWSKQTLPTVSLKYGVIGTVLMLPINIILGLYFPVLDTPYTNIPVLLLTGGMYLYTRKYRGIYTGRKELFPFFSTVALGLIGGILAGLIAWIYQKLPWSIDFSGIAGRLNSPS